MDFEKDKCGITCFISEKNNLMAIDGIDFTASEKLADLINELWDLSDKLSEE